MNNIVELCEQNFDEIVHQHEFVVIDFWAQWCAPCKSFQKVVAKLAPQHPEVVFASVNIEKEPQLAEEFQVQSIPFVMILKSSVVVFAESGALTQVELAELLVQAKTISQEVLAAKVQKSK